MKRAAALFLKSFIAFGLFFIAYEIIIWFHAPALAWGVSAAGRNAHCGAWEGYKGLAEQASHRALIDDIARRSKLVKRDGDLAMFQTPDGEFWIPKGSEDVLPRLLAQQQAKIYGEFRPGDVVLDCGAHVGTYSRQALNAGVNLVIAVEPAPDNVQCLRRAFAKEIEAGRMVVVAKGVWHKEDSLPFYADPSNSAADSFIMKGAKDKVLTSVPLTTIDNIVKELKLEKITLIKMDIKGATLNALRGARDVVKRDYPRIVLSTEEESDQPAELVAEVQSLDPRYKQRCGMCSITGALTLNPDVLFFE